METRTHNGTTWKPGDDVEIALTRYGNGDLPIQEFTGVCGRIDGFYRDDLAVITLDDERNGRRHGFYSPDRILYVNKLVVHLSQLAPLEVISSAD